MLTAKQQQAFDFIRSYIIDHKIAPTDAEIADGIGIKSRGVAHRYVTALEKAGLISLLKGRRRNIELTASAQNASELRVIGEIAAGHPILAINRDETINIADAFLGPERFILRVKGDSMIGDNICHGDYIVCEKAEAANANDIVVALVDKDEATLKRVRKNTDGTVTLLPSNPTLSPLVYKADQVQIQGRYLGLLRLSV